MYPTYASANLVLELVDDDREAEEGRSAVLGQLTSRECLRASFGPVVDDEHSVAGDDRLPLNAQLMLPSAVVTACPPVRLASWKERFALSDCGESNTEVDGDGGAQDESTRLDPGDLRRIWKRLGKGGGDPAKESAVGKEPPDVRVAVDPRKAPYEVLLDRQMSSISSANRGNRLRTARLNDSRYSSATSPSSVEA